jgi:TIR domain/Carboxypeptidase regulatory-like domain
LLWSQYDVFLSYSRRDSARVSLLRDELQRMGYRVFFDVQSIDPGERWKIRLSRSVRVSRLLVLCWSEGATNSDYVTFEYSCAEALHRPIVPWLMDGSPLPGILDVQGIGNPDPTEVAAILAIKLGWALGRRRRLKAAMSVLASGAGAFFFWLQLRPPPPWVLQGEVYDTSTRRPIVGVELKIETDKGPTYTARTDDEGKYHLRLPQPQPATVLIVFSKDGYEGDQVKISSSKPFVDYLQRLR